MRRVASAWALCALSRESSALNSLGARLSKFPRLTMKHHPTRPTQKGGIGATRRVLCKEHLALEIVLADGMRQNNENECHPCVG
jgi:hypothetical protein